MAAPKGEGQVQIGLKVPSKTVNEIDRLVDSGEYGSRSLLIKEAIDRLLNRDRMLNEMRLVIEEELDSGRYDDMIEKRLRRVFGRVVTPSVTE